jgi:hypothetical protein
MEQLIANALIEVMRKDGTREIELSKVVTYGHAIAKKLDNAILLVSRNYRQAAIYNYSEYFAYDGDTSIISLKEGVDDKALVHTFRALLPIELFKVFTEPDIIDVLFAA